MTRHFGSPTGGHIPSPGPNYRGFGAGPFFSPQDKASHEDHPAEYQYRYREDYDAHLGDPFNLGAWCLVVGIALLPVMFVFPLVFFWFALVF